MPCENCSKWEVTGEGVRNGVPCDIGECRARPPLWRDELDTRGRWPTTAQCDWCAEWEDVNAVDEDDHDKMIGAEDPDK